MNLSRSSRLQMLFKVGILKSLAIVTGKRLRWSLYFIKKRLQHRCFTVNITIIFKNLFFVEHLRWLLLSKLLNIHHIHIQEMKAVLVIRFAFCVLPALYIQKSKWQKSFTNPNQNLIFLNKCFTCLPIINNVRLAKLQHSKVSHITT